MSHSFQNKFGNLCITVYEGDIITIGDDIILRIEKYSPTQIRLGVRAPKNMKIQRHHSAKGNKVQGKVKTTVRSYTKLPVDQDPDESP